MRFRQSLVLGVLVCCTQLGAAELAPVEHALPEGDTPESVASQPHASSLQLDALVAQNLPAKFQQMQEVISQLRGQLEEAQHRIAQLEGKPKVSSTVTVEQAKPAVVSQTEEGLYQSAFNQLQGRHYDVALTQFKQYLGQYSQGKFRANVHYWQGEIYLLKGDNANAIAAFDTVLREYPLSQKVPGAMLKKAMALSLDGNNKDAKVLYSQLIKKFPASSAAKLASRQLQQGSQQAI